MPLDVIAANFAAMSAPASDAAPDLFYRVTRGSAPGAYSLACGGQSLEDDLDPGDVLFALEKSLVVELQRRRPDLFFLHAAAIERDGVAYLLAAESGSGKSTTAWGMLHHGFRYLSDELGPIDLEGMRVFPYPHALCLKRDPPPPYTLPANALRLGRTLHAAVADLPAPVVAGPCPLGGVFLVTHRPQLAVPEVRPVGPAEASARLYVNVLNALAHPNRGLEGVARIAQRVPCFSLSSARLGETCTLLGASVDELARVQRA